MSAHGPHPRRDCVRERCSICVAAMQNAAGPLTLDSIVMGAKTGEAIREHYDPRWMREAMSRNADPAWIQALGASEQLLRRAWNLAAEIPDAAARVRALEMIAGVAQDLFDGANRRVKSHRELRLHFLAPGGGA